jgi:uncharacterized membrane protein
MSSVISEHADTLIRVLHILFGLLAVLSGTLALFARKGSPVHARAGQTFVLCMVTSSMLGAVAGAVAYQTFYITIHAGILAMTLILTSRQIVKTKGTGVSAKFGAMTVLSGLNTLGLLCASTYALQLPDGILFGFHAADYAFLAAISGIALIGEIRILLQKIQSPKHRLAAHLWRMCFAFFIAAGSAFTGPGAKIFPDAIRNSGVLSLPEAMIFCAMLYWLFRAWSGRILSTRDGVDS